MPVELTAQPVAEDSFDIIGVSQCLRWCLTAEAEDYTTTPGVYATLVVDLTGTTGPGGGGMTFRLWGYDFEESNAGGGYTATTFEWTLNPTTAAANFQSMLLSNIFFRRATTITRVGPIVTVTWKTCGAQASFDEDNMEYQGFTDAGAAVTPTNGTTPVYLEGAKYVFQLIRVQDQEITLLQSIDIPKSCAGPIEFCIDLMQDAKPLLYTTLPPLTTCGANAANNGDILQAFQLLYGHIYREDCEAKAGTMFVSPTVRVLNAAFPVDDPYKMRRYNYGESEGLPDGVGEIEFLTTQPKRYKICRDSFVWLWYLARLPVESTITSLTLYFVIRKKDGTTVTRTVAQTHETSTSSLNGDRNINVSPACAVSGLVGTTVSDINYYDVYIESSGGAGEDAFTETIRYIVDDCCNNAEVYFLTPPGGIGTLVFEPVDEREVLQTGTEICMDTPCTLSYTDSMRSGGRTLSPMRSYEKVTLRMKQNRTEANLNWVRDFKASPVRWLRIVDRAGDFQARKISVDPGGIKIFKYGEFLEVTLDATYAQDIPSQAIY